MYGEVLHQVQDLTALVLLAGCSTTVGMDGTWEGRQRKGCVGAVHMYRRQKQSLEI